MQPKRALAAWHHVLVRWLDHCTLLTPMAEAGAYFVAVALQRQRLALGGGWLVRAQRDLPRPAHRAFAFDCLPKLVSRHRGE